MQDSSNHATLLDHIRFHNEPRYFPVHSTNSATDTLIEHILEFLDQYTQERPSQIQA